MNIVAISIRLNNRFPCRVEFNILLRNFMVGGFITYILNL